MALVWGVFQSCYCASWLVFFFPSGLGVGVGFKLIA